MGIVDVLDALGAKRSYKEPWSNQEILAFVLEQKGKKFDPALVELVEANFTTLMDIRKQYPD
jgi:response regulator RpfG family c-di-GMP phosphodiesterase